jgi:hypothetical protein
VSCRLLHASEKSATTHSSFKTRLFLKALALSFTALLLLITPSGSTVFAQTTTPGYDVIMLAGQSNMVGYNTTADNPTYAAVSPQVFMWNYANGTIVAAQDPLIMTGGSLNVGPGLTFAKAYAASIASNRKVLLVGVAQGTTGFNNGWLAPTSSTNSALSANAVTTVNKAIAAAGAGAKFVGIIWDQGENDVYYETYPAYQTNLLNLIQYFRTSITGASSITPFIATELTYAWMIDNLNGGTDDYGNPDAAGQYQVQTVFHQLPDLINNTAWTASAVLASDPYWGDIHFDTLSQRQMGLRDADRFFEAQQGLPQPEAQMVSSNGYFIDNGRSYPNGSLPVNNLPTVSGTVTPTVDTVRGTIAQISQGQGFLTFSVPATTFNGSYTKLAWFKPGAAGYYNNLVAANNPGQAHYLAAVNNGATLTLAAGHSNGSSAASLVSSTVSFTSGTWVNIAVSYNATTKIMSLYYNGALVSSASGVAAAPALSGNPVPLTMGSYGATSSGASVAGVDGEMGGNRAWTSALTAAQIAAIYQHELSYRAGW